MVVILTTSDPCHRMFSTWQGFQHSGWQHKLSLNVISQVAKTGSLSESCECVFFLAKVSCVLEGSSVVEIAY